jgi:outer membrane protein
MRATVFSLMLAVSFCCTAGAQSSLSATNTRSLSLEEGIRLALEKNLDLQIAKVDVRGARAALLGANAYYEPVFETLAQYSTSAEASGSVDPNTGLPEPPGDRSTHLLSSGIVGALPWGMQYDIGGDLNYFTRDNARVVIIGTNVNGDPIIRIDRSRPGQYTLDTGIRVTQPLLRDLWTDAGRTQIKLSRADIRISEMTLRQRIHEVVRDVMLDYYELVFARENVVVKEKALELAQRLASENRKRVEVGTLAPLDEKQAEAQSATARADLILALQLLGTQENLLIKRITDNYEQWQGLRVVPTENLVAVPQSYDLSGSWVSALTFRPDFNAMKEELERQGLTVRLAYNQLFPRLDLVGSYGRQGVDNNFSPALNQVREDLLPRWSVGAVLSVPLGNRGARGSYGQATALRDRLGLQVKQLHQNILVEVEDAVGTAQGSFQRVTATREARLAAEAAYDAEVKKLENGKSTSFNVLSLQNDLTTARSQEIRALADYNKALAELYYFEGTILEKHRITVEK